MQIIGQKKIKPKKEKLYKFTCNCCGCVFVANREEIKQKCYLEGIWYEVQCPKCDMITFYNYIFFRRYRGNLK